MKKLLAVILTFVMILSVAAMPNVSVRAEQSGDFEYGVVDYDTFSTAVLTRYLGNGGAVVIPNSLGGLALAAIYDGAFDGCTKVTSVSIPNSVVSISAYAFQGCTGLTTIALPDALTSVHITAFYGCTNLTAISVTGYNKMYSSANGVLYSRDQTTLIQFPKGKAGSFVVPNTTSTIGEYAFYQCMKLTNAVITDSVTAISPNAFRDCGLTSVSIPSSVGRVGDFAFAFSKKILYASISGGVGFIGKYAFNGCTSMKAALLTGSPPSLGFCAFARTAPGFKIYCGGEAAGFTNPWKGYVTTTEDFVVPTPTPTPSPTPIPTPAAPVVNPITNAVKIISGKTISGAILTISAGTKVLFTGPVPPNWTISMTSTLAAGTKVTAFMKYNGETSGTRTVYVKPAIPKVSTLKANSIAVKGTATKGAVVSAKIGTKIYTAKASTSTGAFSVKIPKIKKGTAVSVSCTAGGQTSGTKIVKAI
ncbi:MAG: leucine-rich repeat domain-containing protein [Clostridia bacterium]